MKMTQEKIIAIMDSQRGEYSDGAIRKGLNILAKYNSRVDIFAASHDIVYSSELEDLIKMKVTEKDIIALAQLGWFIDETNSLAHFA